MSSNVNLVDKLNPTHFSQNEKLKHKINEIYNDSLKNIQNNKENLLKEINYSNFNGTKVSIDQTENEKDNEGTTGLFDLKEIYKKYFLKFFDFSDMKKKFFLPSLPKIFPFIIHSIS